MLTGRYERAERRTPAEDVVGVIGCGGCVVPEGEAVELAWIFASAIDADVPACLGFEGYDEFGLLSSLFSERPGTWLSEEDEPGPETIGVRVGHGYVARVGDDGVGLCRPFPGVRCIGFVSSSDNPATPSGIGRWHVAATDCMIVESVERTWDLLRIDVDPEAPSGRTPHPDPDELADFEEQRRHSHEPDDFYDVWRPSVSHVDEGDQVVFLDRYGDRVKVTGVLRDVRTWTPSLSEGGRAEHPVANLRLGDREVVVHFPPSAGSVIKDGAVIHGYVTTCSSRFDLLSETAEFYGETGESPGVRALSSDKIIGRLMKGPVSLCDLADDFAVSAPRMARELERTGWELNIGISGADTSPRGSVYVSRPVDGTPRLPLTEETARLLYRALGFTAEYCASQERPDIERFQRALKGMVPGYVVDEADGIEHRGPDEPPATPGEALEDEQEPPDDAATGRQKDSGERHPRERRRRMR